MKKLEILISMITLVISTTFGQAPTIQWENSYGGTLNEDNYKVVQTSDGGYITCGNSASYDGDCTGDGPYNDSTGISIMWVVKTNSQGAIQWQKQIRTLGTSDGPLPFPNDYAYSVIENRDGDFLVAGGGGGSDPSTVAIIKLSSTGVILDSLSIGCDDGTLARDIIQTYDGGYIVAGVANGSAIGGTCGVIAHSPVYGTDEDPAQDAWILKLDANLDVEWQKVLGGVVTASSSGLDNLYSCVQTADSCFVFAGSTGGGGLNYDIPVGNTTDAGYSDAWIFKLDKNGNLVWNKVYGGGWYDEATSIKQTLDKGFIVGGYYKENSGDLSSFQDTYGGWIFKLDSLGNLKWQDEIPDAYGYSQSFVVQRPDSDFVLLTHIPDTNGASGYGLYRYGKTGNFIWKGVYGGEDEDFPSSIAMTTDGGYILSGTSYSTGGQVTNHHGSEGSWDFWLVKLNSGATTSVKGSANLDNLTFYPNPAQSSVHFSKTVNVTIYNLDGQMLSSDRQVNTIDVSHLNAGVYILDFSNQNGETYKRSKLLKLN